jgi:DNA polymerase I-like protein with 3'-5' exonuclease and polymerase domains
MKFKAKTHHQDQGGLGFSVEEMTRVPQSDWQPPDLSALPDKLYGTIGVDTETCDEGLREGKGAGWGWPGGGFVAGYSVSADNLPKIYLPVAHEGGDNVDHGRVRRWLNHVLGDAAQLKVFAHAMYDIGWAERDGVTIRGPTRDVQLAEALLDEYRREYNLESIARDRLGRAKNEDLLRKVATAYGYGRTRGTIKENLWRLPARYAGPYAEEDAALPRDIWCVQEPLIKEEGLERVCELEHALIPLYIDMRRRGVRVDIPYAEKLRDQFRRDVDDCVAEIKRRSGANVDIWAAASIAKALDAEGVRGYGRTAKTGAPSITQAFLESTDHWLCKLVLRARQKDKLRGTFLEGQVIGQSRGGRVHCQVHPLKSDDGGTVTGRIAMSDPNLGFIPARTKDGRLIRGCFLPEDGEKWASVDISQQEPRLTVHFAVRCGVRGALEAQERYRDDPDLSYHEFAAELTGLPYKAAKILNLAIIYGRGVRETAAELALPQEEVKSMFEKHHQEMPFARGLSDVCKSVVNRRGYLKSLLGRRARFPHFEPARWEDRDGRMMLIEDARRAWPDQRLVRARIHKSLNSLIQPSAADQTKTAMLRVMEAGLGNHILIQIYDELACSVPDCTVADRVAEIMRGAIPLEVPVKVDVGIGKNWMAADADGD